MHVYGHSWTQIARTVGYISPQVAQVAVTAYVQKAAVGRAPELRQAALLTDLERLDMMHAAFWPQAMHGGYRAAEVVMRVIDRRWVLLAAMAANWDSSPNRSSSTAASGWLRRCGRPRSSP
jgi:hypothetical protein